MSKKTRKNSANRKKLRAKRARRAEFFASVSNSVGKTEKQNGKEISAESEFLPKKYHPLVVAASVVLIVLSTLGVTKSAVNAVMAPTGDYIPEVSQKSGYDREAVETLRQDAEQVTEIWIDVETVPNEPEPEEPKTPETLTTQTNTMLWAPTVTEESTTQLADSILSYIITDGMTERERARAVYDWCVSNVNYTTRNSYLMGDYIASANAGFRERAGNCYIFYAASSLLLTRAGVEWTEIHRDSETNPHYWELVNIDGEWYHFDTCPHYRDYPLEAFLLTDAEVTAYSEQCVADYYSFDETLYPPRHIDN